MAKKSLKEGRRRRTSKKRAEIGRLLKSGNIHQAPTGESLQRSEGLSACTEDEITASDARIRECK